METSYATRITLLEKVRDLQDDQAWAEFLELYKGFIYAVIRSMNIAPHDSDDILQLISLRLCSALQDYHYDPSRGKFRSWIAVVTKNEVKTFISKRKGKANTLERASRQGALDYLNEIRLSEIEQIAEREWKAFTINIALEKVKVQFSNSVFTIFEKHLHGQSAIEIAENSDIPRQTVYKYISRVKVSFIEELNKIKDN